MSKGGELLVDTDVVLRGDRKRKLMRTETKEENRDGAVKYRSEIAGNLK